VTNAPFVAKKIEQAFFEICGFGSQKRRNLIGFFSLSGTTAKQWKFYAKKDPFYADKNAFYAQSLALFAVERETC